MRICLVSQEFPPETAHGGIATQTHAKAHGLAARGHEVCVLSHSVDGARHDRRDGAVRVVRAPGYDARLPLQTEPARAMTWSVRVAEELAALVAAAPFDLVDFPEYGGEAYVHLLNRAPWASAPVTLQLQGPTVMLAHTIGWPEPGSDLYRTATHMEATCVRLADGVYSSSRCSADWCRERYGLEAAEVPVLHTGVDTAHFEPAPVRDDRPLTLLVVGRVARSKGVVELVDASARLANRHPGLVLRLVGEGDDALLEELRARAAGPLRLECPGFVPRSELPAEYARADVFAAPSRYEGGPGFVYLEAMAAGLPVVACAGSGAAEVVRAGETGELVPPGDVAALEATLARLLAAPAECRAMGARAREYAVREADAATCLDRLEAYLVGVARASAADGGAA